MVKFYQTDLKYNYVVDEKQLDIERKKEIEEWMQEELDTDTDQLSKDPRIRKANDKEQYKRHLSLKAKKVKINNI